MSERVIPVTMLGAGEPAVGHVVPEVEHAVGAATVEAVSEHHVGLALEDGLEEHGIVARIVLEVGILDQDDVAARGGDASPHRCTLAAVRRVPEHAQVAGACAGQLLQDPTRVVAGGVVHRDDLQRQLERRLAHPLDQLGQRGRLVVDGDHDREHGCHPSFFP
jgi:hypothetical protein